VRSAWETQGSRRERVVVELVEVTSVGELLARPDPFYTFDEFSASSVVCYSMQRDLDSVLGLRTCIAQHARATTAQCL
jgi:hypothetical protein